MRKALSFLSIAILLLACGCRSTAPVGVTLEVFQDQAIVLPEAAHADTPLVPELMAEPFDRIFINSKIGSQYFGVKYTQQGDSLDSTELLVKANPYEETPLRYPDGLSRWLYGSREEAVLQERYMYRWTVHKEYTGALLTRTDMVTGEITVADRAEVYTVQVCPEALDDTHFLSHYAIAESGKTTTVLKVHSTDGTGTEILRKTWSDGTRIEAFAVKNGDIYGFVRRQSDGETACYLYRYSRDGELLDTQLIPEISQVLGDEVPTEFHLVDDYIVLRTSQTLTTCVFKWTTDGLRYLAKGGQYALLNTDKGSYIFYIEGTVNDDAAIKEKDCPLYIINTDTDESVSHTLQLPLEKPYFSGICTTHSGDLILSYGEGTYDPLHIQKFRVTGDTLDSILP